MSPVFLALGFFLTLAITIMAVSGASRNTKLLLISALAVIGFTLGNYVLLGRPDLTRPHAASPEALLTRAIASMDEAGAMLLLSDDANAQAWSDLAQRFLSAGEKQKAVTALAEAAKVASTPEERDLMLGNQAQAIIEANDRIVSKEARDIFAQVLERNHDDLRALFFLGLAAEQEGNQSANAIYWGRVLSVAPEGSPLRASLQARMSKIGVDTPANDTGPAIPPSGPQREMIEGMVARLAGRLNENGGSVEEWSQLAKSYVVLENWGDAVKAYEQVLRISPDNQEAKNSREELISRE